MIKTYYFLTKPGIIFGNIITTFAGFALASKGYIDPWLLLATFLGLGLIIASAGVFNNYIDRKWDARMARTKDRALVRGVISPQQALLFATLLGLSGAFILGQLTTLLALTVALGGFFTYLVLYAFLKYRTFYGTLVGSIAGAVPPVVGYTAVTGQLDLQALLLFTMLVLWQMPHFYAIAIYRLDDYRAAAIPVLPVVRGLYDTKIQMILYIIAFIFSTSLFTLLGYTGTLFLTLAIFLGLSWLLLGLYGFKANNNTQWGKQMFALSLVVILSLCLAIPVSL